MLITRFTRLILNKCFEFLEENCIHGNSVCFGEN